MKVKKLKYLGMLLIREVKYNILQIILEGEIFREKNEGKKADILDWQFEELVQLFDIRALEISEIKIINCHDDSQPF